MKLADVMPWTQKIITMIQKKNVADLLKEGFYNIGFRRNGYANIQADLEDIKIPENEINNYRYDHTAVETRFYIYSLGKFTITICVPLERGPEIIKKEDV